jgi:hypothetical protein
MPNDVIGVSMLKPTSKTSPQFHYIPMSDPHYDYRRDARLELRDSAKLGITHSPTDTTPYDFYRFVDSTNPKVTLLTSEKYDRAKINRTQLNYDLSFMHSASDWRNFEATQYIYVEDATDPNASITFKGRCGKLFGHGNCEGFAYQVDVRVSDCATRFSKSQFNGHIINGPWNTTTSATIVKGALTNKWTGIKFIIYNQDPLTNKLPMLELWIDWSAINDWKKYDTLLDAEVGGLGGNSGKKCGGTVDNQPGTWGGPCVHLEWNAITRFRFKNISAREIDPFGIFSGEGSAAGGGVPLPRDLLPPPPQPRPTLDQFRVKQFYSSKVNGEFWYMPIDVNADQRVGGELPKVIFSGRNSDGSWKIKNQPKVRYGILTTAGFDESKITSLTPATMVTAGFMQTLKDWRNIEMTAYFRVNTYTTAATLPAQLRLIVRGGLSTTASSPTVGGKPPSCEATQYHGEIFLTGSTQFQKCLQFNTAFTSTNTAKTNAYTFKKGAWLGVKFIVYNVASTVYMALYLDENTTDISRPANVWKKSIEYTDAGSWNSGVGSACGGTNTDVILWGGPVATFSSDNITDFDIALCSIREIDTTLDPPLEQNFMGDTGALGDFSGWLPLASDWGFR